MNCCYCSLKKNPQAASSKIPTDLKEKGIYLSPNSDPFTRSARDESHQLLERFLPEGVQFLIITKNIIPTHTINLLAKYAPQVYVQISLSRMDDKLNNVIEPGASSAEHRLETMHTLLSAGVRVTPIMMPLFPGIDDTNESLIKTIDACAKAGAKYLKAAFAVLDPTDVELVKKLTAGIILKQSFRLMTEYQKIHIGGGLTVPQAYRKEFYERITQLCTDRGICFQTCPILDPAVLDMGTKVCATYKKKN
ncbi:MAG: radical SAM protein [candidate division SR1 bacterium]|nr:radical SAM protein [candidate division SR1 bacterium]